MKSLLSCFLLCFVVNNFFGMDFKKQAMSRQPEIPATEQREATTSLVHAIMDMMVTEECGSFDEIKMLLDQGADPNSCFFEVILNTRRAEDSPDAMPLRIMSLFLAKGANPNRYIQFANNPENLRLLLGAGANINAVSQCEGDFNNQYTCLFRLCTPPCNVRTLVWALMHGADPNTPCTQFGEVTDALHQVVRYPSEANLAMSVALLQYGARFNIGREVLAALAHSFCYYEDVKQAQLELLQAVHDRKLDSHIVHSEDEYMQMGITRTSARLIKKATQQVNDEVVRCVEDDFAYRHGNWTQFVLDREVGRISRRKR